MATTPHRGPSAICEELFRRLDDAVRQTEKECICREIKGSLVNCLERFDGFLSSDLLLPAENGYARRLLHKDPEGRYSAVVMVWGPGQATPLHDHAGRWCVEGVYAGRIRVTSYEMTSPPNGSSYSFRAASEVLAGRGEAGMLIPPFEYHTIENPFDELAATLHVYDGELSSCHVFVPEADGTYRRERRELCYSESA